MSQPTLRRALPVRRVTPAYQHVADELGALIVGGDLPPGERLPVEAELCEMFGVSRSTVREALRLLSSRQLVTTVRGVQGGTFVVHPDAGQVSDYLTTSIGLLAGAQEVDVAELLEARELLEVPAARLAAQRRTTAHLAVMRESLAQDPADIGFVGNRTFHEAVVEASGNRLLSVVTSPLFAVLRDRFLRDEAPAKFWTQVAHDHGRILAAIEAGDGESAAEEMRRHLGHLASTYRRIDRKGRRT